MSLVLLSTHTSVNISGLVVETFVGQGAPERRLAQPIHVDITCLLRNPAVLGDDLTQSADYVPLVKEIRALAKEKSRRLIETFAEEIAQVCLANELIRECCITIEKRNKLPQCDAVGVTRTFTRKGE